MRKNILFIIFIILLLPITFSEILLQTTETSNNGHSFTVNKYYFQNMPSIPEDDTSAILIQPNITEKTISQCSQIEYSFLLANPTLKTQSYSIGVEDFKGTAYLPPNLIIPSKEIRKINLILMPECEFSGSINPKIIVETLEEKAKLSLILNVLPVEIQTITENDCLFFYNETICNSEDYIKFYQGTKYYINLDDLFFDPDGDKLEYSATSLNLDISIKKGKAKITPLYDFYGAEQVVFYADDLKGGKAQSKTFYFHVLNNGRSSLENFFILNLPLVLGILIFIFIILLLIALIIRPIKETKTEKEKTKNSKKDIDLESDEEDMPAPPKPSKRPIKKKK